ncbi:MAG: hypothetical protein AAFO29_23190 [Actinomycetota bacterium]
MRPGGQLIVIDFAPHHLASLRTEQAHRRLGFHDDEMADWFSRAGLDNVTTTHLVPTPPPGLTDGQAAELLTVSLWSAHRPDPIDLTRRNHLSATGLESR